jgi:ubiquinone/menaquinone biosynthesis C-methylase UbiE
MIRAARARMPSLHVVGADATVLPFRDSVFDVVTASFVFSHLPHPETGIAEARRVLKPGGRFALTAWAAGLDAPTEAWTRLLGGAVGAEKVASAVKQVAPSEAELETESSVVRVLDRAGFTAVAVHAHVLETIVSVEQFVAGRVLAPGARYARHVLDREEWEQLVGRAREDLADRFGPRFPFTRGVLIGVGTKG